MKKPNYTDENKRTLCEALAKFYKTDVVTTKQVNDFVKKNGLSWPYFLTSEKQYKAGWGKYQVANVQTPNFAPPETNPLLLPEPPVEAAPVVVADAQTPVAAAVKQNIMSLTADEGVLIPEKDPTFEAFGFYTDLRKIIKSKIFYPVYITGLSGNGKTLSVIQACADAGREIIRVNITKDTDELDLFGGYELIDGNTFRREGPVLTAMKRGAILLLDETDYGSERLLCLQPILEGKPFLDKKTNTMIYPKPGFNVIACANTKGRGSSDGRFIGANVLNEAFLERFAITVEQEYPSKAVESKILKKNFVLLGIKDDGFADFLVEWAAIIRKSYDEGAASDIISTRRLVHVAKAYSIFENKERAIKLCLNRFDEETSTGFYDLYTKCDASINEPKAAPKPPWTPEVNMNTKKADENGDDSYF